MIPSARLHAKTAPDFYDYIVVDEFHHAVAPTYQKLLSYYQPQVLLDLTATLERMDGKSVRPYFNNRIAAEIRLPEAINRKLLCPFQYFGITDLDEVKGLGFCIFIEHAEFMCHYFNGRGIPSIFLAGKSSDEERKTAKGRLVGGEIRFIFVVDIYNEGVDILEVNTVLFLWPRSR